MQQQQPGHTENCRHSDLELESSPEHAAHVQRRSGDSGVIAVTAIASALMLPITTLLLLNSGEYVSYTAASTRHGDTASLHVGVAQSGIVIFTFLTVCIWIAAVAIVTLIASRPAFASSGVCASRVPLSSA
jgi:hypothetical protein